MILFNEEILTLVREYNSYSKANNTLYRDKDVAKMLKTLYGVDRFNFVDKCNEIARKLIPLILPYNDKNVIVSVKGKEINGVLRCLATRKYTNSQGHVITTDDSVSFRTYKDSTEGIALWVDTANKFTTHLYNTENIELLD
jgi:hypothetical protein